MINQFYKSQSMETGCKDVSEVERKGKGQDERLDFVTATVQHYT